MGKRKKKERRSSLMQKALLALSCLILVLCVASITYGFFLRRTGVGSADGDRIRVEVLNGTGENGLAQRVAFALRKKGIDVIKTGNAKRFDYGESILVSRKKGLQVERIGKILGCSNAIEQLRKDEIADVTLILGADYRKLKLRLEENSHLLE